MKYIIVFFPIIAMAGDKTGASNYNPYDVIDLLLFAGVISIAAAVVLVGYMALFRNVPLRKMKPVIFFAVIIALNIILASI